MVARIGCELVPNSGPALIVDQGRLLTGVEFTLVRDLAGVNRVREQCIEMTARERFAATLGAIRCRAAFRPKPETVTPPLRAEAAESDLLHPVCDSSQQQFAAEVRRRLRFVENAPLLPKLAEAKLGEAQERLPASRCIVDRAPHAGSPAAMR